MGAFNLCHVTSAFVLPDTVQLTLVGSPRATVVFPNGGQNFSRSANKDFEMF